MSKVSTTMQPLTNTEYQALLDIYNNNVPNDFYAYNDTYYQMFGSEGVSGATLISRFN